MALETEADLVALADGLTRSADIIHARLRKAIQEHQADQATAQRIFQEEGVLRQRANALYLDAASRVIPDLKPTQESLLGLVATANDRIATAQHVLESLDLIADLLALAADLLALAAAAGTAKARPILAALQVLQKDVETTSWNRTFSRE